MLPDLRNESTELVALNTTDVEVKLIEYVSFELNAGDGLS